MGFDGVPHLFVHPLTDAYTCTCIDMISWRSPDEILGNFGMKKTFQKRVQRYHTPDYIASLVSSFDSAAFNSLTAVDPGVSALGDAWQLSIFPRTHNGTWRFNVARQEKSRKSREYHSDRYISGLLLQRNANCRGVPAVESREPLLGFETRQQDDQLIVAPNPPREQLLHFVDFKSPSLHSFHRSPISHRNYCVRNNRAVHDDFSLLFSDVRFLGACAQPVGAAIARAPDRFSTSSPSSDWRLFSRPYFKSKQYCFADSDSWSSTKCDC